MPIIKKSRKYDTTTRVFLGFETTRLFEGRVLRVKHGTEHRNVSDTLDYSDWQTVKTVWALVWLGTHGLPPRFTPGEVVASAEVASWELSKVRDLDVGEQYAWIDCSNVFADRNGFSLEAEVDTFDMQLLHGGPAMLDGLAAWEAFHAARREQFLEESRKATAEREAREAAEKAKKDAAAAKRAAKAAAGKAAAEGLLGLIPAKGTRVTVNGFSGTIFWRGVASYYGKWNARAGVKDAKGNVQWIDAAHWAA